MSNKIFASLIEGAGVDSFMSAEADRLSLQRLIFKIQKKNTQPVLLKAAVIVVVKDYIKNLQQGIQLSDKVKYLARRRFFV